jgi:hypothetical protein
MLTLSLHTHWAELAGAATRGDVFRAFCSECAVADARATELITGGRAPLASHIVLPAIAAKDRGGVMKHRTSKILIMSFLYVNIAAQSQTTSRGEISQASVREMHLINTEGMVEQQWAKKADFELRRRPIQLNTTVLSPVNLKAGDILRFNLFDGEEYSVKLNRVVVDVNNILSISGKIDGTQYGYFYLSTKERIVLAMVEVIEQRKKYLITYNRSVGIHYLTEVDPLLMNQAECRPPLSSGKSHSE